MSYVNECEFQRMMMLDPGSGVLGAIDMAVLAQQATIIEINLDEDGLRPDILKAMSTLSSGQRLTVPAGSGPQAIRDLIETLLPGHFDWRFEVLEGGGWQLQVDRR